MIRQLNSKAVSLIVALLVLGLGIAHLSENREPAQSRSDDVLNDSLESESVVPGAQETSPEAEESGAGRTEDNTTSRIDGGDELESRAPVPGSVFTSRLVNKSGDPIAGAKVSWTSFYSEWLLGLSSWQDLSPRWADEDWISERTVHAVSDADGNFAFSAAPASIEEKDSVIWVTHEGFMAQHLILAPGAVGEFGNPIEMTVAHALRVHVQNNGSMGVPGARVDGWAVIPSSPHMHAPIPISEAVRLFLRRSARTDSSGWSTMPNFPGKLALRASSKALRSDVWRGSPIGKVHLELSPTFTASGKLTLTDDYVPHPDENSVTVEGWTTGIPTELARANFDPETMRWGPVAIPLAGHTGFHFRFRSHRVTASTKRIQAPKAGDHVEIDFEGYRGNTVWFGLLDSANQPLSSGSVEVFWEGKDGPESVRMKLMEDGYTTTSSIPDGQVTSWRGSSPGYAPKSVGGFAVPEAQDTTHGMILLPGGLLIGKCIAPGVPIDFFEVIVWPTEDPNKLTRKRFPWGTDGSFVLNEAPLGEVQVVATAGPYAPSPQSHVTIAKDSTVAVVLNLEIASSVKGTILDSLGNPIIGARVQSHIGNGRQLLAARGEQVSTDFRGEFTLNGLASRRSAIKVQATGYSPKEFWVRSQKGRPTNLEPIRMSSLRDLQVRVLQTGGIEIGQCQFSISLDSISRTPYRPLSATGTIVFPETSIDTKYGYLALPDDTLLGVRIPPPTGREWIAEYRIGGSGSAVIDFDRDTHEGPLPPTLKVNLDSYARGKSSFVRSTNLPAEGEVFFGNLNPGKYLVRIADNSIDSPGSTVISVVAEETTYATVRFDEEPSAFRIVDQHGAPTPGVTLSLYDSTYPLWRQSVSDASGMCIITGSPPIDCFAGLQHSELGDLWGLPVTLGQGLAQVIELEFRADHSIRLRLMDGDAALGQVECRLRASDNREVGVGFPRESDAGGQVSFDHIGPATYSAEFRGPGVWPTKTLVEAKKEASIQTVQLRRVGDLTITVLDSSGDAAPGAYVQLQNLDLQELAEEWIAEGKLLTSPASTTTGHDGSLTFPAIPRGTYRWTVMHGGVELVTGETELLAGEHGSVTVALP